jgi:outer membrane lipoprotein-sorting protein
VPKLLKKRCNLWMAVATLAAISCGCGGGPAPKQTTVPQAERPVAKEATREELLEKYNAMASSVNTVNSTVELKTTAGSKYSGLIQEYHEVKAFLLAARPANVRVIGQAPVIGKTIFDMASDGSEFRVWLPTKNKFLVGEVALERTSEKPLENLRPQHLLDALLWQEIRKEETVLLEEFNDENGRYYVLTQLRGGRSTEIYRKIWFDRADLSIARLQFFGPRGVLLSDVRYANWQPLTDPPLPANGPAQFPRTVHIDRPHDDYKLDIQIAKIVINSELEAARFQLAQPTGAELVRVTADAGSTGKSRGSNR